MAREIRVMQPGASFCSACGGALAPSARFCTRCGAGVAPNAAGFVQGGGYVGGSTAQGGVTVAFAPAVLPQAPRNEIPEYLLAKWSWGPFWGVPLWAFWNGDTLHKVLGVVLLLLCLGTGGIFWPVIIGYQVYMGIRGNRIAAANRRFSGMQEFLAVQRAWSIWGFILFLASLVMAGAMFFFLLALGVLAALL